jgi:DNA-binding transcriptional MocR family regulator
MKPGCGWLPSEWMPTSIIRRDARKLINADEAVLADYGATHCSLVLRRMLVRKLADEGIDAGADQVLLTASGTQAIASICRLLLRPGDTVLVDDPGYFNFRALLKTHGVNVVGAPHTLAGPDVTAFAAALATFRPRSTTRPAQLCR